MIETLIFNANTVNITAVRVRKLPGRLRNGPLDSPRSSNKKIAYAKKPTKATRYRFTRLFESLLGSQN